MTTIRYRQHYENHLTYPMVVDHCIVEVLGWVINNWDNFKQN